MLALALAVWLGGDALRFRALHRAGELRDPIGAPRPAAWERGPETPAPAPGARRPHVVRILGTISVSTT